MKKSHPDYEFTGGSYGRHLKAVIETIAEAARALLLGPPYMMADREVPRMAFRVEILDDLRLKPLEQVILTDLLRYGLLLSDYRGKSVRGALVPRLYLRRLLLPICLLPLSKRDSVQLNSRELGRLLTYPDEVKELQGVRRVATTYKGQMSLEFKVPDYDAAYDDLEQTIAEDRTQSEII
jgi:hypothetical protein